VVVKPRRGRLACRGRFGTFAPSAWSVSLLQLGVAKQFGEPCVGSGRERVQADMTADGVSLTASRMRTEQLIEACEAELVDVEVVGAHSAPTSPAHSAGGRRCQAAPTPSAPTVRAPPGKRLRRGFTATGGCATPPRSLTRLAQGRRELRSRNSDEAQAPRRSI
jgi:hypothetical protein